MFIETQKTIFHGLLSFSLVLFAIVGKNSHQIKSIADQDSFYLFVKWTWAT